MKETMKDSEPRYSDKIIWHVTYVYECLCYLIQYSEETIKQLA